MQNSDHKNITLLFPCGNKEALKAAVAYNADAVYLGVDKFNARMKTDNFTLEELPEYINFAHLFGTKVYVTLNTLIKENEFEEACAIADKIYLSNADGLILTDLGLIDYCLSRYKNIEIFLSTQLSVSNIYAAEFAQKIGCTGIVLARETSLNDIRDIAEKTDLKIEAFIHGAMCVCVSGQCYMSSMADGNSGNRGRCAQPCRKKYFAYNNGKLIGQKYYLSMRDMNSTSTIKTLIDAGVTVFKTEGRNRRPEYVAQSALTYKNLVKNNFIESDEDNNNLKKMFNRGNFTTGYAFENNGFNLISDDIQGHKGVYVGKVKNIDLKNRKIYSIFRQKCEKGDAFKIIRNNMEVGNAISTNFQNNKQIELSYSGNVNINDDIYITTDTALIKKLNNFNLTIPICIEFYAQKGKKAQLKMLANGYIATIYSDEILTNAQNYFISEDSIRNQLSKLGDSYFHAESIKLNIDADVFCPLSLLNSMRRLCIKELENLILTNYNDVLRIRYEVLSHAFTNTISSIDAWNINLGKRLICFSEYTEVDISSYSHDEIFIYKPYNYFSSDVHSKNISKFKDRKWYLDIPAFCRHSDIEVIKDFINKYPPTGLVINNIFGIQLSAELFLPYIAGLGLNITNKSGVSFLRKHNADNIIISKELNIKECLDIGEGFIFNDGALVNMTLCHCPYKVLYKYNNCMDCKFKHNGELKYKDEMGNLFSIIRRKLHSCYFELMNCADLKSKIDLTQYNLFINKECFGNDGFTTGRIIKGVK